MSRSLVSSRVLRLMTEWQLAWLAGFIDGEGCIGIYKNGNSSRVTLKVSSTYLSVIDFIYTLTGIGNVEQEKRKEKNKNALPQRVWSVSSVSEMKDIITKLLPYLLVKTYQAIMMLEYCDGKLSGNLLHDSSYYYEKTKVLNHSIRGIDVSKIEERKEVI